MEQPLILSHTFEAGGMGSFPDTDVPAIFESEPQQDLIVLMPVLDCHCELILFFTAMCMAVMLFRCNRAEPSVQQGTVITPCEHLKIEK